MARKSTPTMLANEARYYARFRHRQARELRKEADWLDGLADLLASEESLPTIKQRRKKK